MYVIISASDMESSFLPASKPLCKTLIPINGKPVLQYILDELYSYQAFVDEIVVVKRDAEDVDEYLKYNEQDEFFLTKIHCVNGREYKQPTNRKYSILDDFYAGMEFLVDELKVSPSEVLLWSADELIFESLRLTDQSLGSFRCVHNGTPIGVCRFNRFPQVVNSLVYLKNDLAPHTLEDFIDFYRKYESVDVLTDFGEYKEWSTQSKYYELQSELTQKNEYADVVVEIDTERELITKTNKFADLPYSYETMERSRKVQYNLWSEYNFLENATAEQAVFLPKPVERGVNQRGDYCDSLTREFVSGTTLSSLLLDADLPTETWKEILTKVVNVTKSVFHKDELEDDDELYHSFVPKEKRELYSDEYVAYLKEVIVALSKTFSKENERDNYFVLSNNDIAEWNIFVDDFAQKHKKHLTKERLIYNGTCERLVHNNLLFENVLFDTFSNKLNFITPRSRLWQFVDKDKDYARLYLSALCGYDALKNGKHKEENGMVSIAHRVQERMNVCKDVLDELTDDPEYLKQFAIVMMLEAAFDEGINTTQRATLLKYASQLKRTFVFNKIFL